MISSGSLLWKRRSDQRERSSIEECRDGSSMMESRSFLSLSHMLPLPHSVMKGTRKKKEGKSVGMGVNGHVVEKRRERKI